MGSDSSFGEPCYAPAAPQPEEPTMPPEPEPGLAPADPLHPVCMECSFASGGHVHVTRDDGTKAVRYPMAHEWNKALRDALSQPPAPPAGDGVREEAAGALSRESFLRHIHILADADVSQLDGLHPSEVALCGHDAAMRRRNRPYQPSPHEDEIACRRCHKWLREKPHAPDPSAKPWGDAANGGAR